MSALVVGLGNLDRGDDGVGPMVAERVRDLRLPDVDVLLEESPASLTDLWTDATGVVVVDAVRGGAPAGTVTAIDAVEQRLPSWVGVGGTHGFGVAEAVELARALDRLPARLVVVGVEAECFDLGCGLSSAVADAVPRAVDAVVAALAALAAERA